MQRMTRFLSATAPTVQSLHVEQAFAPNAIYTQCVRWKRKPIWLPPVKSKEFRVPKRPEVNEAEALEIARLYNNYRTQMRAIRYYFVQQVEKNRVQTDQFHQDMMAKDDFKRCSELNNAWNAMQAVQREKRMAEEKQDRLESIAMKVAAKEERDKLRQKLADEAIRKLKDESKHLITPENIDAAIADALETIVNPNYAVDINGKIVTEFNTAQNARNPRFNQISLRYMGPPAQKAKVAETSKA